jgi:FAD/FMN-containing dehydrogenase
MSMPVDRLYALVEDVTQRLRHLGFYTGPQGDWPSADSSPVRGVVGYGHMGDGNLHLNISTDGYAPSVVEAVEPYVYEWVQRCGGSISAEHGLGLMKAPYVGYSKSAAMLDAMRKIKHVFDPNGIMNPYKFLP